MSFVRTLLDELLALLFQGAAAPAITGPLKISLHTADPGQTGASEVAAGAYSNYARASVARSAAGWTNPATSGADEETHNAAAIDFGTAVIPGAAPTVTHVGLWDSAGVPRFLGSLALADAKTINNGDPVKFAAAGDLTWTLT